MSQSEIKRSDTKKPTSKSLVKQAIIKLLLIVLVLSPILMFFILSPLFYLYDPNEHGPWVSWSGNPDEQVYISWETEEKTSGILKYGIDEGDLNQSVTESEKTNIHHVNLTGLSADTTYYYEVEIDGKVFGKGKFRTAPSSQKDFTFGLYSDTQQNFGPGHHFRVGNALKDKKYAFIVNVGDIVQDGGKKEHYNNFFKIGSEYLDTIPFIPVIGNHDQRNVTLFTEYFINQVNKSQYHFYYSFNWSNVHFCFPHFAYGSESEMTDAQLNWLKKDLSRSQDKAFRIVMFHCPIKGASFFGPNEVLIEKVQPILLEYNVTATVHGHEHHFERGNIKGMTYFISGGGGGALDVGLRPLPETEVLTESPNFTEVHVTENEINFKTMTLEGSVIDDFTIQAEEGV
ncbi:MAG: metallophosphoesterase family protein [Promethearchaeia archaeon]